MEENPVVASFAAHRVPHDRGLLNWLDPLFEKQILSMCLLKYNGKTRVAEDVWETITESAARAGIKLDADKERK
jgi:hypothetical protein